MLSLAYSRIRTVLPPAIPLRSVNDPDGQRTVTLVACVAAPSPKCRSRLEEHPYPDQPATRSHCFPSSVSTSTHAPMASRLDFDPCNSNAIQLPLSAVRFHK